MKNPTDIVSEFLQNTAPDKIEAAAERLIAEDAIYISLSFDNPELKKILPWTGTSKGREAYTSTFIRVARYWTVEDFSVSALFGTAEDVAVFGSFTYRSNTAGILSLSLLDSCKVREDKIVYFQFMEDTFASSRSFSSGGAWTIKTDPNGPEYLTIDRCQNTAVRRCHVRTTRSSDRLRPRIIHERNQATCALHFCCRGSGHHQCARAAIQDRPVARHEGWRTHLPGEGYAR
jgi:hypothetical protein